MQRSLTQDIRDEREDLREAAESTLNAIVDLNLDGTIKWASPSWADVVGTESASVEGTPIADLIVSEPRTIFTDVIESMKKDDSKSHRLRFAVQLGPLSKLRSTLTKSTRGSESIPEQDPPVEESPDKDAQTQEPEDEIVDLEAQGIMVYDTASGGESHVSCSAEPSLEPD
jgi:serine/threonine-protein kinase RIM15